MYSLARSLWVLIAFISVLPDATSCRAEGQSGRPPRGLVRSLGSTVYRHTEPIELACLDPTGRTLYTLSYKGVYAWDLETGESRLVFHAERVRNSLSISPDGRRIASIAGNAAGLWDATTGDPIREFHSDDSPGHIAFRPDGRGVLLFSRESIEYRSLDGKESRILGKRAKFCWPAFAPGGGWFAVSLLDESAGEIAIYDVESLRRTVVLRVGPAAIGESPNGLRMLRVGISADGRRIAVPAVDGSIAIREVVNGKVVRSLQPAAGRRPPKEDDCRYLLFTKEDRQLLAGTAAGTIRRWEVGTGQELAPMRAHRDAVRSLHLTPEGGRLISTSADGTIRRWEVATGRELPPPDGYSGSLHARLGPRGETVLLLDGAGRMDIWDLGTGRIRTPIRPRGNLNIETPWVEPLFGFTGDGRQVYVAQSQGKIEMYDAGSGRPAGSLVLPAHDARPKDLRSCISAPDGGSFVVNRGPRQRRIRASDGAPLWESPDLTPRGLCYPPALTRDGKGIVLAVTTYDKPGTGSRNKLELVRLDLASGKVVARTELKSGVAGSPSFFDQPRLDADGRLVLLWYNISEFFLIDALTNRPLHHYVQVGERPDLSPDGRRVVSYFSGQIAVYDAATGNPLSRLPMGRQQTVQSLHVLPDGRHVFTAGDGSHACLWDLDAALPAEGGPE
ncbi:MAG: hypothetical protein ACLQVF_15485 [Isosphaeraceae bacterium]